MSKSWDAKIASAKKGIQRSQRALKKYRVSLQSSIKRSSSCKSSSSKRNNSNRKRNLRDYIKKSRKKIEKHKKAIKYYQGRKSGRIKGSNLTMSDFTR